MRFNEVNVVLRGSDSGVLAHSRLETLNQLTSYTVTYRFSRLPLGSRPIARNRFDRRSKHIARHVEVSFGPVYVRTAIDVFCTVYSRA